MAGFATVLILAVLCTGVKAAANGEGQKSNECSQDDARIYYRHCVDTNRNVPTGVKDAKGRPVTLWSDMSAPTFQAYLTAQCSVVKAEILKCFQKFFSTTEGRKCHNPEPLTIMAQETGGFCGAEGLSTLAADSILPLAGKWNNGCLGSSQMAQLSYYCGRQRPASGSDLEQKLMCYIRQIGVGKMEDCSRGAILAYLASYVSLMSDLGAVLTPAQSTKLSQAIAALPP